MKSLVCLVMLVSSAAAVQDMTGKMFLFPLKSDDAYVRVNTTQTTLSAVTLCHRSFTDLKRSHTFFSLATPDFTSFGFETFYNYDSKEMSVWIKMVRAVFGSVDYPPNKWHSVCTTWDSGTGLVQLWMNGQPSPKIYIVEFPITGQPQIILGQKQSKFDNVDTFRTPMTFVGMLADVHMWDHVISACEIQSYTAEQSFTPGNVFNWMALDFQTGGRVLIDDKQTCNLSTL